MGSLGTNKVWMKSYIDAKYLCANYFTAKDKFLTDYKRSFSYTWRVLNCETPHVNNLSSYQ